jgi:hypothetical protein
MSLTEVTATRIMEALAEELKMEKKRKGKKGKKKERYER